MSCYLRLLFFVLLALSSHAYSVEEGSGPNISKDSITVVSSQEQSLDSQPEVIKNAPTLKENLAAELALTQNTDTANMTQKSDVGKHVMANMDAMSMTLSLLLVLGLIVVSAYVLKRFQLVQQGSSHLKIVSTLPLSSKERVVIVQAGEQQLVLGVTAQQITLLERLEEPLSQPASVTDGLMNSSVLSFLKK